MQKFILLFLAITTFGFAETFVLDNQSTYPNTSSKTAIQWASSAAEVQEQNSAILHGLSLNTQTMQVLHKGGKVTLSSPKGAKYFRILIWSQGKGEPDLLTNWVDIQPGKTYPLTNDRLVPAVLMAGSGC